MSTEADGTGNLPYSSSKQPETREMRYDKEKKINYDPATMEIINPITGDPTGEIYQPEKKPETDAELERNEASDDLREVEPAITVTKSGGGVTRYTYPVISVNTDINGVTKEIGVRITFEKQAFGNNFWYTGLIVDGAVVEESKSEDAFVVSTKAQNDIQDSIIRALALSPQQADEIIRELISAAKKHENDILSMDGVYKLREMHKLMVKKDREAKPDSITDELKEIISELLTVQVNFKENTAIFRTKMTTSGLWETSIQVNERLIPHVNHEKPLCEHDPFRDKNFFLSDLAALLNTTSPKCKILMVDVVAEAQKQADKFNAIIA